MVFEKAGQTCSLAIRRPGPFKIYKCPGGGRWDGRICLVTSIWHGRFTRLGGGIGLLRGVWIALLLDMINELFQNSNASSCVLIELNRESRWVGRSLDGSVQNMDMNTDSIGLWQKVQESRLYMMQRKRCADMRQETAARGGDICRC